MTTKRLIGSIQLAGLEETQDYVPFQVAVSVAGKGPELDISRLNFELHDAYGEVHETVDAKDLHGELMLSFFAEGMKEGAVNVHSTPPSSRFRRSCR